MQNLVSTDNSGINLVITRKPSLHRGTLTPELYRGTLALYQVSKLDGYTEHACREITRRGPGLAAGLS